MRALLLGVAMALLLATPAAAANTIALNGPAVGFGEFQKFSVTIAQKDTQGAFVRVTCYQGGEFPVWSSDSLSKSIHRLAPAIDPGIRMGYSYDVDPNSPTYDQQVVPSAWTSGSASCTAELWQTGTAKKPPAVIAAPISWDAP